MPADDGMMAGWGWGWGLLQRTDGGLDSDKENQTSVEITQHTMEGRGGEGGGGGC